MAHKCDATLTDIQTHCSDDIVEVWHGMMTPAYGCGKHVNSEAQSVFNGHRVRESSNAT